MLRQGQRHAAPLKTAAQNSDTHHQDLQFKTFGMASLQQYSRANLRLVAEIRNVGK